MASVSDHQLRQLMKWMKDSGYTCTEEWLMACVDWINENYPGANFETFKRELTAQWKDTNLEEMESSCLPEDLAGQRLNKLSGKYGLQINSIRDIGESSYSQFIKIKNLENENSSVAATDSNEYKPSWQPKPRRSLYLTMTDGTQSVFGMEMQPIPTLSLMTKPGTKVLVLGPVECRRGIFHLKPNNIRVEGGEVEDLQEANNSEKIICDIINNVRGGAIPVNPARAPTSAVRRNRSKSPSSFGDIPLQSNVVSGDFPDSPSDPFGDADDDIFMDIDEQAIINSVSSSATAAVNNTARYGVTSSTSTASGGSTFENSFRTAYQGQQSSESLSSTTNFTEEIEDYEDDPDFEAGERDPRPSSVPSKPDVSKPKSNENVVTVSTTNSTFKRPTAKAVFVPPIKKKPATSASTSSNQNASSSTHTAKIEVETDDLSTTSTRPSKTVRSKKGSVTTSTFKTAKAALTSTANTSGSGNGKPNTDIRQFMKPMPVVIDPPTPERQVKRRRKSRDEEGTFEKEQNFASVVIKQERKDNYPTVMETEQEAEIEPFDRDENLMRMVDMAVENSLSEETERVPDEAPMPSSSSICNNDLKKITTKMPYPIRVSELPFIFIQQIQENMDILSNQRKVVKVKACISTVVSNISVENGSWTLGVCINDGTGYINCRLSSDLLNNIVGLTPTEMRAAKKTSEGKQTIKQKLGELQQRLVHLNALLEIEIGDVPLILNIIEPLLHHSTAIKDRLEQIGLQNRK